MTKIVCVASGKGGVGKTTSVVNLGSALNKFGYDTIIIDGNINTPDLGLHLGMPNKGISLHEVLNGEKSIYESVYIHPNGTKIVPSNINMWGLLKLSRSNINKIKKLKDYCDIILLDCSPGINGEAEACIKACDELLIVTNPDIPSVTNALKTVVLAKKHKKKIAGVIINKKVGKRYEMSDKNIEEFLGAPIISIVPEDERVRESLTERKAVVDAYPFSKASVGFKKAAARIVGQEYENLETSRIGKLINFFRRK